MHKVNIFHLYTSYRFLNISCENCKLQSQCDGISHKSEACKVVSYSDRLLSFLVRGHILSFSSDDFYVLAETPNAKQKLKRILKSIQKKYMSEQHVRQ